MKIAFTNEKETYPILCIDLKKTNKVGEVKIKPTNTPSGADWALHPFFEKHEDGQLELLGFSVKND